jgi:putative spermidine/putrescine transport system substrate-binding protein
MFTILKGTDNFETCRQFILFCLQGERQAAVGRQVAIAPTNPNAFKFISPERATVLATNPPYQATGIEINDEFWAANRDAIADRFNKWLLS